MMQYPPPLGSVFGFSVSTYVVFAASAYFPSLLFVNTSLFCTLTVSPSEYSSAEIVDCDCTPLVNHAQVIPARQMVHTMIPRNDGSSIRQTEDSAAMPFFMKLFCRLFNSNTSSRYFSAKPSGPLFLFHCKAFPAAVILNTDSFLLIYCIFFKLLLCTRNPGDLNRLGSIAVCQTIKGISGHHKTCSTLARYAKHAVSTFCKLAVRCTVLSFCSR